jgi:hypothetical protein
MEPLRLLPATCDLDTFGHGIPTRPAVPVQRLPTGIDLKP